MQDFALDLIQLHEAPVGLNDMPLWMTPLSPAARLSLVSSSDWLGVHLIPLYTPLLKTHNSTGPSTDPQGTPFMLVLRKTPLRVLTGAPRSIQRWGGQKRLAKGGDVCGRECERSCWPRAEEILAPRGLG